MPDLHGKPFKSQLRREIAELQRESWNERKEHAKTRQSLRYARAKIAELESRIEKMKQFLQSATAEADREIGPATFKRFEESFRTHFDRAATG
jgi:predicted  nucleic acid-binding Zn-ribbon protein